jgi:flagellar basal-body rod protein FlgB
MIEKMADFSILPLDQAVTVLGEASKGARLEHTQIANNIANVNTPNFRSSYVDFQSALKDSLGTEPDPDELAMVTNDDRQFAIGDGTPPVPYDPQPQVDTSTQMRVDGSNVDIDQQMSLLSENTSYKETMSQLMQEQYKFVREAVTEQTS